MLIDPFREDPMQHIWPHVILLTQVSQTLGVSSEAGSLAEEPKGSQE